MSPIVAHCSRCHFHRHRLNRSKGMSAALHMLGAAARHADETGHAVAVHERGRVVASWAAA